MKAVRLLKMMRILRRRDGADRDSIVAELNITERQFYLDKNALRDAGFIFKWIRKEKRFAIIEDPFVETVELQMSEALALGCAIDALARGGERELARAAKEGLERLLNATRAGANEVGVVNSFLNNVSFDSRKRGVVGGAKAELVVEAATAMVEKRELVVKYHPPEKPPITRRIQIHSLFMAGHTGTALYADCFSPERNDYRTFRLSRVSEWMPGDPFTPQANYDFKARYQHVFQVIGAGDEPVKVTIHAEPKVAAFLTEKEWHPSLSHRYLPGGSAEVTMEVTHPEEVLWWSLLWEGHAFITRPYEMVEKALGIIERMKRNYDTVLKPDETS